MGEKEERLARNEAIFREINERTRSLQERFGPEDPTTSYVVVVKLGDAADVAADLDPGS